MSVKVIFSVAINYLSFLLLLSRTFSPGLVTLMVNIVWLSLGGTRNGQNLIMFAQDKDQQYISIVFTNCSILLIVIAIYGAGPRDWKWRLSVASVTTKKKPSRYTSYKVFHDWGLNNSCHSLSLTHFFSFFTDTEFDCILKSNSAVICISMRIMLCNFKNKKN